MRPSGLKMISYTHNFLFIDIVKTAGTSINEILRSYGGVGKHHSIRRPLPDLSGINDNLESPLRQDTIEKMFKFTIVRNPYDRLVSLFAFTQESALQKNFKKGGWDAILNQFNKIPRKGLDRKTYWPTDFTQYVDQLVDHEEYYCDYTNEKYITMTEWLLDNDNNIQIDYVGYYETLQNSFNSILHILNLPTRKLPQINVSNIQHRNRAISELFNNKKLQNKIYFYYKDDFINFSYKYQLPFI